MGISEKEFEDFVCKYPDYVLDPISCTHLYDPDDDEQSCDIIGRQISLKHGVLDLLIWDQVQLFVIELKARNLKEADIGQVLRYTHDVQYEIERCGTVYSPDPDSALTLRGELVWDMWRHYHGMTDRFSDIYGRVIVPVLIGRGVNENVCAAAEAAGIQIVIWERDPEKHAISVRGISDKVRQGLYSPMAHGGYFEASIQPWAQQVNRKFIEVFIADAEADLNITASLLFEPQDAING